jgi:hypothetical protein
MLKSASGHMGNSVNAEHLTLTNVVFCSRVAIQPPVHTPSEGIETQTVFVLTLAH